MLSVCAGVGVQGEVVSMAPPKARKALLLPKLGVYASPDNLTRFSHLKNLDNANLPSSKYSSKVGMQHCCYLCFAAHHCKGAIK